MCVVCVTGLAHVCVVTECMTITRARIEVHIPRKRRGSCENHDKVCPISIRFFSQRLCFIQALRRFYETVMQAVLRHVKFDGRHIYLHTMYVGM